MFAAPVMNMPVVPMMNFSMMPYEFYPSSPSESSTCASPSEVTCRDLAIPSKYSRDSRDAKRLEHRTSSKGRRPNSLGRLTMMGNGMTYSKASSSNRDGASTKPRVKKSINKTSRSMASSPVSTVYIRDEEGNVYEMPVFQIA